jgi:hypothetical protein
MANRTRSFQSSFLFVVGLFVLVGALAACGGDSGDPSGPGGASDDDDAVRITQGTNPTVEGLSLGLSSVSGDEARLSVVGQDGDQNELVEGRPGARIELGEYVIEFVEVAENDEGGYATVIVTPPDGARESLRGSL